jgi:hypothetical protein
VFLDAPAVVHGHPRRGSIRGGHPGPALTGILNFIQRRTDVKLFDPGGTFSDTSPPPRTRLCGTETKELQESQKSRSSIRVKRDARWHIHQDIVGST